MDQKKLDALRQKYSDAKGGDIHDPEFAAVAAQIFSGAERRKWPFADPATFLGLPFRPDALAQPDSKARCRAHRRADGPRRHQSRRSAARAASGARGRAHRPVRARAADRAGRPRDGRRHRRRADAKPVQPRAMPCGYRGVLHAGVRRKHHSAGSGRRPFDHLFDPQGNRPRPARRHGAHRCALRHGRRVRRVQVPSRRAVPAGGAGRRARSGALDPDRHPRRRRIPVGVFVRQRDDRAARRGRDRDGHPRRRRPGARGGRRRADST